MAGGLFVLPGIIAIMALSWLYAAYGHVPLVTAFFFGLKAAVLAIVIEAVVRIGKRALANDVLRALAAVAFVAHLLLRRAVSADRPRRGRWSAFSARRRAGTAFKGRSQHGGGDAAAGADDSLLGDAVPAHARPDARRAHVDRRRLARAVARPGRSCSSRRSGPPTSSARSRSSSARWRSSPSAAPTRSSPMSPSRRSSATAGCSRGEMLDGLGMAETTPGPLIMVLQFVGFMAAFRDARHAAADARRRARRPARDLGHLHAVLPVDLRRRALHRGAARQPRARRRRSRRSPRRSSASSSISRSGSRCTRSFAR